MRLDLNSYNCELKENRPTLERNEKLRGLLVVRVGISVVYTMKTFRICHTKVQSITKQYVQCVL